MILTGIKAQGKLDPYVVSYISHKINLKYNTGLFSIIFASFDPKKNEKKKYCSETYSNYLFEFWKEQRDFVFNEAKYFKYLDKFIEFLR